MELENAYYSDTFVGWVVYEHDDKEYDTDGLDLFRQNTPWNDNAGGVCSYGKVCGESSTSCDGRYLEQNVPSTESCPDQVNN